MQDRAGVRDASQCCPISHRGIDQTQRCVDVGVVFGFSKHHDIGLDGVIIAEGCRELQVGAGRLGQLCQMCELRETCQGIHPLAGNLFDHPTPRSQVGQLGEGGSDKAQRFAPLVVPRRSWRSSALPCVPKSPARLRCPYRHWCKRPPHSPSGWTPANRHERRHARF